MCVSASRPQRPRRSAFELANAVHTNACGSTRDVSRPGKRGSHRPPAVPFRRSHHAPRPWPFTGGGSGRLSRPFGRRRSPCDQCGSTAATGPPRGRPQACWLRAGRRQWTASWALAGEPRALPGNLLAAAVRGAEHRLLAHGPAVQPWLRRSPPTRVRVWAAATVVPVSRLMGGDRVGGRWGGAYALLLTLVKSRRLTSANSNRLRSLSA